MPKFDLKEDWICLGMVIGPTLNYENIFIPM